MEVLEQMKVTKDVRRYRIKNLIDLWKNVRKVSKEIDDKELREDWYLLVAIISSYTIAIGMLISLISIMALDYVVGMEINGYGVISCGLIVGMALPTNYCKFFDFSLTHKREEVNQ